MNKNINRVSVVCLCLLLSGCSMFQSALNDIKGNLVGNGYTIYTYDNYGSEVMETSGDKISITGNAVESTSYDENGSVVRGYELSSVITITVDGKETEIYTPFLMATGMILSTDKFQNIKVDNGEVVSEGDNDIIMAYGMPGLKDSLDLAGLDFGDDVTIDTDKINDKITDTVKITADVKDFEMGASYTVATASLFKDIDFGDIDSLDDLDDRWMT